MAAAHAGSRSAAPFRLERAQFVLLGLLLALAAVAWLVTDNRMGGMESGPGMALGGLGFYITVWVAMMAAMMFPAIAPVVKLYGRAAAAGRVAPRGKPRGLRPRRPKRGKPLALRCRRILWTLRA